MITVIPPEAVKLYLQSIYTYKLFSDIYDFNYNILKKHDWIHYRIFDPIIVHETDNALILNVHTEDANVFNSIYKIYSSTGAIRVLRRYDIKAYLSRKLYYIKKKILKQLQLYNDMLKITNFVIKKITNKNIIWR